ncbi:MAG: hypothetical protein PHC51_01015 [bacterium]|nr:hypothetical protein [bacterium]
MGEIFNPLTNQKKEFRLDSTKHKSQVEEDQQRQRELKKAQRIVVCFAVFAAGMVLLLLWKVYEKATAEMEKPGLTVLRESMSEQEFRSISPERLRAIERRDKNLINSLYCRGNDC